MLNVSGTSFGALSPPAIQSLSAGAKLGGFAHNTGEEPFQNIMKQAVAIQFGKFRLVILDAVGLTVTSIHTNLKKC